MTKSVTLSYYEADLLLEALTIWAWGENGDNDGASVEFGTEENCLLNNEQISDLFTRIGNAKFSAANTGH